MLLPVRQQAAHLYFLKELNKIDAALVFAYFVGDTTVPGRTRSRAKAGRPR